MLIKNISALFFVMISGLFVNNIYPQGYNYKGTEYPDSNRYNWFEKTSSKDNMLIADSLAIMNFEDKINAIPYIAKRKDKNFSLILDKIFYQEFENKNEKEQLLYLMIDDFFTDEESVENSKDSFLMICENISGYKNSILRKKIMEKTVLLDTKNSEKILIKEAMFLLNEGNKSKKFDIEMLEETRFFYFYSEKIDSPVLKDYRQMIYIAVSNIPYTFLD